MYNKTSIFFTYATLVLFGIGGIAILAITGTGTGFDTNALVAFIGFYGFLCTTGVFYVLAKNKVQMDAFDTHLETLFDEMNISDENHRKSQNDELSAVERNFDENFSALERKVDSTTDMLWSSVGRIEDELDKCRYRLESIDEYSHNKDYSACCDTTTPTSNHETK